MDYTNIKNLIEKYHKIIIFHHILPDGDALGSCFGLKELIETNYPNKEVYVVGGLSGYFDEFFPAPSILKEEDYVDSLGIILDCPNKIRVDDQNLIYCSELIKIDHHIYVETYCNEEWIDTSMSSTCEMIVSLARDLKWKINKDAASYLYLGLTTDANRFLYGYSSNLFDCAKLLVESNADVERIYPFIYEEDVNDARFYGYCKENFKIKGHGVAYNKLTPDVLAKFNMPATAGGGNVNALANMKDIDIWAHFSETKEGTIRTEIRSKGLPVNTVAEHFGGGGHKQASGCILLNWDEVDKCLDELDNLILINKPYYEQLKVALDVASNASKLAMTYYNKSKLNIEIKDDESPVTEADKKVDEYIRTSLHNNFPTYGLLSEESIDDKERLNKDYVWIIDPIDGTEDYIAHDDEFAINIALSYKHEIVVGVIAVPAKNKIYYAIKDGGAFINDNGEIRRIYTSNKHTDLIAVRSRYHQAKPENDYFRQFENLITDIIGVGSAYKMGLLAEGKCDVNLKLSNKTKEWDIAPGVIIVKEAHGSFTKPNGEEYRFNREDVYNQEGYIILNKKNKGLLL